MLYKWVISLINYWHLLDSARAAETIKLLFGVIVKRMGLAHYARLLVASLGMDRLMHLLCVASEACVFYVVGGKQWAAWVIESLKEMNEPGGYEWGARGSFH